MMIHGPLGRLSEPSRKTLSPVLNLWTGIARNRGACCHSKAVGQGSNRRLCLRVDPRTKRGKLHTASPEDGVGPTAKSIDPVQMRSSGLFVAMCFGGLRTIRLLTERKATIARPNRIEPLQYFC